MIMIYHDHHHNNHYDHPHHHCSCNATVPQVTDAEAAKISASFSQMGGHQARGQIIKVIVKVSNPSIHHLHFCKVSQRNIRLTISIKIRQPQGNSQA